MLRYAIYIGIMSYFAVACGVSAQEIMAFRLGMGITHFDKGNNYTMGNWENIGSLSKGFNFQSGFQMGHAKASGYPILADVAIGKVVIFGDLNIGLFSGPSVSRLPRERFHWGGITMASFGYQIANAWGVGSTVFYNLNAKANRAGFSINLEYLLAARTQGITNPIKAD